MERASGIELPIDFLLRLDTGQRVDQIGNAQPSVKLALGNILVASGQITREQLQTALAGQAGSGLRLGEELIAAGHAARVQVEAGLLLQKRLLGYALGLTVGLAPLVAALPGAQAAQGSAVLAVSARVIANARLQTHFQAMQLQVSAADRALGQVEVAAASRFSVTSNSRDGYRLEFHPVGDWFESVQVDGLGSTVTLGAEGGAIVQRGALPGERLHELSFRFKLRPGTEPAVYRWPLQLSVRAL